jgi:uracil-DNA glycosylase
MNENKVKIEVSWYEQLKCEFEKEYFKDLRNFIVEEKSKYTVYPPGSLIFNAFNKTPFDKVKVILLGQDPYHGAGQAHGLCFSVPFGIKPPPSLVNIYKELQSDVGFTPPSHGNLEPWTQQGVFLLNATLTVRANTAGSHQNRGWEIFTDKVISVLNEKRENIAFVLWGKYAQAKEQLIDNNKHLILKAAHPSPFSAYNGFFGCRHFSKINEYFKENKIEEINWNI